MRIAMVAACPFPWPRGTPVRIHRMAEALVHRGHEVHVVTYHLGDRALALPFSVHRIRDVPGYAVYEPGPTLRKLVHLDPLLTLTLRQLLHSQPFDIIHAHHYEGLLSALCAQRAASRPPLIYDAHTLLASELPYYGLGLTRSIKRGIGRRLDRWAPRRADHVIAVSEEIRSYLTKEGKVAESAISVIPNGVESAHFSQAQARSRDASADPQLMFTGNLAAYQGIDLLLRAFALVRRRFASARLLLLTDSGFEPYELLARTLGIREAVQISGVSYQRLPGELQSADVLLNPRMACDGLPQKILNYMAAGKPIVSFASSAKLLEHEHSGLVVQDGDVEGFANAAMRLLSEPELGARLAANAQRLVTERYTWQQVAVKVEEVYQRLLDARCQVIL